jgi:hypothetical protein
VSSTYAPIYADKVWATSRMSRPVVNSVLEADDSTFIDLPCRGPVINKVAQNASDFRVRIYLAHRIRPSTHKHTNRKYHNTRNLQFRVPLPPHDARQHRGHAAEAAQDNVHGHGDVERERPVVQHVDAVEEESDVRPSRHGYTAFSIVLVAAGEERHGEGYGCDEGELEECY